jgi:hypothetical protein
MRQKFKRVERHLYAFHIPLLSPYSIDRRTREGIHVDIAMKASGLSSILMH